MCIAEAVGYCVLSTLELQTADAYSVLVSDEFAEELTEQYRFDGQVVSGRHWGTELLSDSVGADLGRDIRDRLEQPSDLFRVYLSDVLLANRDRTTYGNALLQSKGSGDAFALIPIDQSECFGGAECMRDTEALMEVRDSRMATAPEGMEALLLQQGEEFVDMEFEAVLARRDQILRCIEFASEEWYERAEIDPSDLRDFLRYRLDNLTDLGDLKHWRGMFAAMEGGYELDI